MAHQRLRSAPRRTPAQQVLRHNVLGALRVYSVLGSPLALVVVVLGAMTAITLGH